MQSKAWRYLEPLVLGFLETGEATGELAACLHSPVAPEGRACVIEIQSETSATQSAGSTEDIWRM